MKLKVALLLTLFLQSALAKDKDLDSASQQGLQKTQKLLRSKSEREQYMEKHPEAKNADKKVDNLTANPKLKEQIYGVSSDVFANVVKETGGDSVKLQQLVEEAMKNPEAFYNKLSPEQKAQIRGIADQIEKESPPSPTPD